MKKIKSEFYHKILKYLVKNKIAFKTSNSEVNKGIRSLYVEVGRIGGAHKKIYLIRISNHIRVKSEMNNPQYKDYQVIDLIYNEVTDKFNKKYFKNQLKRAEEELNKLKERRLKLMRNTPINDNFGDLWNQAQLLLGDKELNKRINSMPLWNVMENSSKVNILKNWITQIKR